MLPGMAGRVRVREIGDDEGNWLRRIVHRGAGSVRTWRRAPVVPWPARGMSVAQITGLAFTSEDRAWDALLHNFNADGARRGLGCARPTPARLIPPPFRRSETRRGDTHVTQSHRAAHQPARAPGGRCGRRPARDRTWPRHPGRGHGRRRGGRWRSLGQAGVLATEPPDHVVAMHHATTGNYPEGADHYLVAIWEFGVLGSRVLAQPVTLLGLRGEGEDVRSA